MHRAVMLLFTLVILATASLVCAVEPAPLAVSSQDAVVTLPTPSPVLDLAPSGACLSHSPAQVQSGVDLEILSPKAWCKPGGSCFSDSSCCGGERCYGGRCG
jgi:hypothetical protein